MAHPSLLPCPASSPAVSQHIAAIVLVPLLLLLIAALVVAIACLAVKYRRRRTLYQVESASPRRTSILQEVGQIVKKKLSVISGNIPYTETVSGSESVENLREHTHTHSYTCSKLTHMHMCTRTQISKFYIHMCSTV